MIAVVKNIGELEVKDLKRGGTKNLKTVKLTDQSGIEMEINFWGEDAT